MARRVVFLVNDEMGKRVERHNIMRPDSDLGFGIRELRINSVQQTQPHRSVKPTHSKKT